MLVWIRAPAAAVPSVPLVSDQEGDRRAGADSHRAGCAWLSIGKGVTELRTRQDVLLPMLPAQEILP